MHSIDAYTRLVSSGSALANHLEHPYARGHLPKDCFTGAAGGAACGDLVRISLQVDLHTPQARIQDVGFDAHGCGAAIAAGSAAVSMVRGRELLSAARLGSTEIAAELGGLSPAKLHAAELAADALHRALGSATRARGAFAPQRDRTLVAMSGGVDSAVAALLSAEAGQETVGVTLELWSDPENDGDRSCCSAQAVRSARELAHRMGMAHLSIDLREEFRAGVVEPWLSGHAKGLTPNPCIRCNGEVRLDAMLDLADRVGAHTLVTGHYARIQRVDDQAEPQHREQTPLLRVAVDQSKDQSYALAALSTPSLQRLRFPLGALSKTQVRELARAAGLSVARKPDSQDLCFLAGTSQRSFLARHGGLDEREGAIVDRDGTELGSHRGAHGFTVGQRHGLGIGGGEPLYVLGTNAHTNTVTVGSREQLLTRRLSLCDTTLLRDGTVVDGVKVRYRGRRCGCARLRDTPAGHHQRIDVELLDPMERTAPGQLACLYSGDLIVGHGTIASL